MQRLYAGLASQVQRNHMGSLGMLKINVERYVGACILAASTQRQETRDDDRRDVGAG